MGFRELKPEEWLQEIEYGLQYRQKFGIEQLWGTMEAIYYNVHPSMANDGPNIFLSQGDSMLSMLTVPTPRIQVKPTNAESVSKAPLVQALDNMLIREVNLVEEAERASLLAYIFGVGFIKVGYDSEWGYEPGLDIGGSLKLGLTLTQLNKTGTRRLEHDRRVVPGMPWARAVMPHDIVVPWGTRDLDSAPWIAHRVVRHIEDLKADQKYTNVARLTPKLSIEDFVNSYRNSIRLLRVGSSHKEEYIEIWEIHDRRTGKLYVVVPDHDRYIRKVDNALQIENRLPFASIRFTPSTRALWTTPDTHYLLHIQNELSDVARQRTKQRRISTVKFLYDEGVISEEELAKILSPDVGAAAKIEAGRKLSEAIIKLESQANPLLGIEEEHLRQNAREQLGQSRNQLGEFTGGRKTATEVATVDRSSQLRMSRRGLAMRRLYVSVVEIINGIVFTHWTRPRFVEVAGPTWTTRWEEVSGVDLKGRYSYEVTLTDEVEEKSRKFEALNLYSLLSQDPTIDPIALREFLVNEINDPRFERIFNANVQLAMSLLRQGGGVDQQNGSVQQSSNMRGMPRTNGTANNQTNSPQLASRGFGA